MKKILLILTLLLCTQLLSDELAWVNEQIEAIKPPRSGMSKYTLSSLKDPFIFLTKKTKTKSSARKSSNTKRVPRKNKIKKASKLLSLTIVINKKAMINGKWYVNGDSINGYKVKTITAQSVLLVRNKKKLLLSVTTDSKKLNFKNK